MALPPSPAPYLSEGRYVTTLAVVHSIMVDHLEELSLVEVSAHLKEQILVHKREKEKMAVENNAIYLTVTHFIADCNRLVPGSSEFVKRFHDFMTWMLIALGLEKKYWNAFVVRIKQDISLLHGGGNLISHCTQHGSTNVLIDRLLDEGDNQSRLLYCHSSAAKKESFFLMALPPTKPPDPPHSLPENNIIDGGNTSPTTSTTEIRHIAADLRQNKSVLHWES
ncbi:Uncharacterized protein Fot_26408 [Forsythia ovata]|uniref:Uncharacterized protein n=1 Tax=Forsythia ovata TaxID=205694 RepID=A0ABD1UD37_9LAMI